MKVRAVGPFLATRSEPIQRHTREGLFQPGNSSGAGRPGSSLHDGLHLRRDPAVVMNSDAHAVIVVLDLAAYAVRSGRYYETPPETGESVDGGRAHDSVPRQQQRGSERSTSGGAHRNPRITRNLAGAAFAAQLYHRFMSKAEAIETAGTVLAAKRVER